MTNKVVVNASVLARAERVVAQLNIVGPREDTQVRDYLELDARKIRDMLIEYLPLGTLQRLAGMLLQEVAIDCAVSMKELQTSEQELQDGARLHRLVELGAVDIRLGDEGTSFLTHEDRLEGKFWTLWTGMEEVAFFESIGEALDYYRDHPEEF